MTLSQLLFFILAINGLFATQSDQVGRDAPTNNSSEPPDAGTEFSLAAEEKVSRRRLQTDDDVDNYVNDDPADNELLYVVYDYDGGAYSRNFQVIDPKAQAPSSAAFAQEMNETDFGS